MDDPSRYPQDMAPRRDDLELSGAPDPPGARADLALSADPPGPTPAAAPGEPEGPRARRADLDLSEPRAEADDSPAEPRVGPYRLLSELGRGAMGAVYRARDAGGREVALKLVSGALEPTRRERFAREGQLAARLSHPGIVGVHAAGEHRGRPWLAYELVAEARTLDEAYPARTWAERAELVAELCEAVGAAHAAGVVHRDLKPDNVLLDARGRVRVADFGLATAADLERLTRTGTLLGTPLYAAPELFRGEGARSPAVDVWSLGVILYEALTDQLPFVADSLVRLALVLQQPPAPPRAHRPALPLELEAIVLRALALDPAQRFADAGALAAALRGWRERSQDAAWGQRPLLFGAAGAALSLTLGVALLAASFAPAPSRPASGSSPSSPDLEEPAPAPARLGLELDPLPRVCESRGWTLSGRLSGAEVPRLELGRESVRVGPEGSFSLRLPLELGANRFELVATSERGERLSRALVLWRAPRWWSRQPPESRAPVPLPAGVRFDAAPEAFVNERDGSELVYVPPMDEGESVDLAGPVRVTRAFFIGRYELTWARFSRYCREEGFPLPRLSPGIEPTHPVCGLSWNEAVRYCRWAGLRLPSEAEWLYAAGAHEGRRYTWGNGGPPTDWLGNFKDEQGKHRDRFPRTSPVGAFPDGRSLFGCDDMGGNVFEWLSDGWERLSKDAQRPLRLDWRGVAGSERRVSRGGGYDHPYHFSRAIPGAGMRWGDLPDRRVGHTGFRVARDAE